MCACASSTKPYHHSNPIRLKDQHHPQIRDSKDLDCNFNFSKDMQNTFSFFECRQKLAERSCKCSSFANVVHSVTENPESKLQNVPKQIIPNPSMPINAHQCPKVGPAQGVGTAWSAWASSSGALSGLKATSIPQLSRIWLILRTWTASEDSMHRIGQNKSGLMAKLDKTIQTKLKAQFSNREALHQVPATCGKLRYEKSSPHCKM